MFFTESDDELWEKSTVYNSFNERERKELATNKSAFFFHNFAFYSADFYVLDGLKEHIWPILSFIRKINNQVHKFSAAIEFKNFPIIAF